jgi:hypothetical protein
VGDNSHVILGQKFPGEKGSVRWCIVVIKKWQLQRDWGTHTEGGGGGAVCVCVSEREREREGGGGGSDLYSVVMRCIEVCNNSSQQSKAFVCISLVFYNCTNSSHYKYLPLRP